MTTSLDFSLISFLFLENSILIYLSDKPYYPIWLRHIGKCSARTKQGYLWIVVRSKSSDTEEKRWETQSKDVALNISLFMVVCGWATQ